ncbi:MAG: hypothetical protein KY468_08310 [Armatimonadetes bacterium]|nr:hypothetical protein [Armatimonadota bacterium]
MAAMIELFKKYLDKLLDGGGVKIDEVSSIKRTSRDEYKYIEGDHEMLIYVEVQAGYPGCAVYSNSIREWLPPYDNEEVTDEDKERILKKVCSHLEKSGLSYEVI